MTAIMFFFPLNCHGDFFCLQSHKYIYHCCNAISIKMFLLFAKFVSIGGFFVGTSFESARLKTQLEQSSPSKTKNNLPVKGSTYKEHMQKQVRQGKDRMKLQQESLGHKWKALACGGKEKLMKLMLNLS
jgi:hypothetical protein